AAPIRAVSKGGVAIPEIPGRSSKSSIDRLAVRSRDASRIVSRHRHFPKPAVGIVKLLPQASCSLLIDVINSLGVAVRASLRGDAMDIDHPDMSKTPLPPRWSREADRHIILLWKIRDCAGHLDQREYLHVAQVISIEPCDTSVEAWFLVIVCPVGAE